MDSPFTKRDGWTVEHNTCFDGDRFAFTFPNGWGASVVRHRASYGGDRGLWELAVIGKDGSLNYEHPVSEHDVRGNLSVDDVNRLVSEIADTTDATKMLNAEDDTAEAKIVRGLGAIDSLSKM